MSELILGPNFPYARCAETDPDGVFYPSGEGTRSNVERARQICATCPHIFDCLDYALAEPAGEYGVWGGTTEKERVALRRELGVRLRRRPPEWRNAHTYGPPAAKETA